MKKTILFLVLFAASVANAEQVPVTQITGATASREALRTQINTRLVASHDNFTEIYTLLGGSPWLAQATAPSIHNVFWIDTTGAPPTIKYWDGDSWEVAASGGDGTYTLPAATRVIRGGVVVGDRLTITDGVLSADVQTTDISGKQDTLVSGTNIKTINGTSVLGLGNIVIDGGSISLATEQNWTAVQNFNSGLTATGLTQNLTSWGDWTFGGAQIVNASGTSANEIWPASTIITALEGKSNTTHNHSGVYEPADSTIIKVSEIDSLAEFEALLGWSPGSSGINEVDSDPSFNSMATGVAVVSKASGDLFVKTSTGGYTIAGVYTADPITYGLTIDFVGVTGSDKITLGGTDYSLDTTITGLSGATSFTVVPDTGRTGDCVGTGISGTTPNKSADMTTDRNMTCTFSAEEVLIAQQIASSAYSFSAVYGGASRVIGQSFTPLVSGNIHKLRFYASSNGLNANVTVRVGTSTDLITDTVDSAVIHVEGTKALYEVTFTGISVTSGVPVYIGMTNSGDYNSSVIVYGSSYSSYADGSAHTSSSGYPMVPGTTAYDIYFEALQ